MDKEGFKAAAAHAIDEMGDNPLFQKGIVAGQHMRHCEQCMNKMRAFEEQVLNDIYAHAIEGGG